MKQFTILVHRVLLFAENGDPIKDAIESSGYTTDTLLVELARRYVENRKPKEKEKADL